MDDNQTAVAIVAIVFLSPVIAIVLLRLLRGGAKSPSPQDQAQTQALMAVAERMERRIDSLEMLLDSELPGWRSRSRNP